MYHQGVDTQEIRQRLGSQPLRWTLHAIREAAADRLSAKDIEAALRADAQVIEDYPDAARGACCLVLTHLPGGRPVHAVLGYANPDHLVVITVYEPDPKLWSDDFMRRRQP